jgi:hypothetical protein
LLHVRLRCAVGYASCNIGAYGASGLRKRTSSDRVHTYALYSFRRRRFLSAIPVVGRPVASCRSVISEKVSRARVALLCSCTRVLGAGPGSRIGCDAISVRIVLAR